MIIMTMMMVLMMMQIAYLNQGRVSSCSDNVDDVDVDVDIDHVDGDDDIDVVDNVDTCLQQGMLSSCIRSPASRSTPLAASREGLT